MLIALFLSFPYAFLRPCPHANTIADVNSNIYSLYLMMIFFTTIIASYGSLSEIIDHGFTFKEIGLIMIVFYCMTILFIICNQAHHASIEVGYNFQELLLNVNLMQASQPVKKEVEMFLVAIQKNPPVMNLNGYAEVGRGLLTSVSIIHSGAHVALLMVDSFHCQIAIHLKNLSWQRQKIKNFSIFHS